MCSPIYIQEISLHLQHLIPKIVLKNSVLFLQGANTSPHDTKISLDEDPRLGLRLCATTRPYESTVIHEVTQRGKNGKKRANASHKLDALTRETGAAEPDQTSSRAPPMISSALNRPCALHLHWRYQSMDPGQGGGLLPPPRGAIHDDWCLGFRFHPSDNGRSGKLGGLVAEAAGRVRFVLSTARAFMSRG
jgi:hypothetical protein